MISSRAFELVLESVRDSGAGRRIDALLAGSGGRPRQLSADVYLAAAISTFHAKKTPTLVNLHAILTKELSVTAQRAHGIRKLRADGSEATLTIRQVRYMMEAIEKKLAIHVSRAGDLGEEAKVDRQENLARLVEEIIEASLPAQQAPSAMALDSTAIPSWARGKRRPKPNRAERRAAARAGRKAADEAEDGYGDVLDEGYSADPDASWGYRTKTYDTGSSYCFGYDVHAMVGVPAHGANGADVPILTYGISIQPCGTDVVAPSLRLLDRMREGERPVDELLVDRGYSYKDGSRWGAELARRGIAQVLDLHPSEVGPREHEGMVVIAGVPHCPALPEELWHIQRPARLSVPALKANATSVERDRHQLEVDQLSAFADAIAERLRYSFVKVARPRRTAKDQGAWRWACPAQAGKLRCANCPMSAHLPADTPEVADPPDPHSAGGAPVCCTQRTVTVPGAATRKLAQEHYWGSPEWITSFARRTRVEGFFGNLKGASTSNVRHGWCRLMGIVKTSVMVACAVAATNISLLRAWAKRTGDYSCPLAAPLPETLFAEVPPEALEAVGADPPPGV